jgi:3-deoxy-7-phosphoheptulonate synthase
MSLILTWGARIPTCRIGRVAGQYSKPRSSPTEVVDGKEILSFKGDNINKYAATEEARQHDPERLVDGHFHSACTLNYIRTLLRSGYANLRNARGWDLGYDSTWQHRAEYEDLSNRILESLDFMDACGANDMQSLSTVDFFTSHEGMVLDYESAVTEQRGTDFYNTGAHFLWIGDRTRDLDGAHIEYFRGICNPIGMKVGPTTDPDELIKVVKLLNPNNELGRITLITRLGAGHVEELLPPVIRKVRDAGLAVVWICDPMHGNTHKTSAGIKTRNVEDVFAELVETFQCHIDLGSRLGGVHFELTGDNVTECVGGPQNISETDLHLRYTSYCDPRLNYAQSMELSFRIARMLTEHRTDGVYKKSRSASETGDSMFNK